MAAHDFDLEVLRLALTCIKFKGGRVMTRGDFSVMCGKERVSIGHSGKISVECYQKHEFRLDYTEIAARQWCPYGRCSPRDTRPFELLIEHADKKGGRLLSPCYGATTLVKLEWQCEVGHTWFALANNIITFKSWCKLCGVGRGESLVRAAFEEALGVEFQSIRPDWLGGLELDGYAPSIWTAFERHGIQHYERSEHFQTEEQFEALRERDNRKMSLCVDYGIHLYVIPYTVGFDEIRAYVRNMLEEDGHDLSESMASDEMFAAQAASRTTAGRKQLKRFKTMLGFMRMEMVTKDEYLGYKDKHDVRCVDCATVRQVTPEDCNNRGLGYCKVRRCRNPNRPRGVLPLVRPRGWEVDRIEYTRTTDSLGRIYNKPTAILRCVNCGTLSEPVIAESARRHPRCDAHNNDDTKPTVCDGSHDIYF
jgi:hypothetical protein